MMRHLSAGLCGGVTSTLLLHPLDMVKIRQAAGYDPVTAGRGSVGSGSAPERRGRRRGVVAACRRIIAVEGVQGLYRGITPNVCGAGASWGLYFTSYETMKRWSLEAGEAFGPLRQMTSAATAGLFTLAVTNPVTVIRTRLCLQTMPPGVSTPTLSDSQRYRGTMDALRKTYRIEGVRGFYRGFVPGMCGVVHGAVQFTAYEQLKSALSLYRGKPRDAKLSTAEYIQCAALSKMFAVCVTYPYQVVRACLQDQKCSYKGCSDVLSSVVRADGVLGLYRGLAAHLWHVLPNICVVLAVYETVMGNSNN